MKATINQTIGNTVAKYRKSCGMTQEQLAERLNLSLDAVSRLERGGIGWTVERLLELADIFNCDTVDLLQEGSTRVRDQAVQLEALLRRLDEPERVELLNLIRQMVAWKKGGDF
ncbi:helix-turn-helix domain-containing protein [Neisseria sp. ZJ106]|uniref:Helix-turn-helix transcriptional regulator n=1 Tax=Neisseria lisongii TaxID=2912188 RepID=A0ABY7RLJ9_9NEIS|nr:helix-turn-helix transcriptional regulator [Neisseria lisongii]MCF7521679.1 helix-turn-helix domain-containing protein [Neisseria lisongii]WCL72234.1 helix-turn-helix transcriptional regulator [Neisseria lisongii]